MEIALLGFEIDHTGVLLLQFGFGDTGCLVIEVISDEEGLRLGEMNERAVGGHGRRIGQLHIPVVIGRMNSEREHMDTITVNGLDGTGLGVGVDGVGLHGVGYQNDTILVSRNLMYLLSVDVKMVRYIGRIASSQRRCRHMSFPVIDLTLADFVCIGLVVVRVRGQTEHVDGVVEHRGLEAVIVEPLLIRFRQIGDIDDGIFARDRTGDRPVIGTAVRTGDIIDGVTEDLTDTDREGIDRVALVRTDDGGLEFFGLGV